LFVLAFRRFGRGLPPHPPQSPSLTPLITPLTTPKSLALKNKMSNLCQWELGSSGASPPPSLASPLSSPPSSPGLWGAWWGEAGESAQPSPLPPPLHLCPRPTPIYPAGGAAGPPPQHPPPHLPRRTALLGGALACGETGYCSLDEEASEAFNASTASSRMPSPRWARWEGGATSPGSPCALPPLSPLPAQRGEAAEPLPALQPQLGAVGEIVAAPSAPPPPCPPPLTMVAVSPAAVPVPLPLPLPVAVNPPGKAARGGKTHVCSYCGFATPKKSTAVDHLRKHTGERFPCPYADCSRRTTTRASLHVHIRAEHLVVRFSCRGGGCGKTFTNASNRRRHESAYHKVKPAEYK
jgi:hypothetical protein